MICNLFPNFTYTENISPRLSFKSDLHTYHGNCQDHTELYQDHVTDICKMNQILVGHSIV